MSDSPFFTPKTIWHGKFLDGKLTVQTTPEPLILNYYLFTHDYQLTGTVTAPFNVTAEEMVEHVLDTIKTSYLNMIQNDVEKRIRNGNFRYH